MNSLFTHICSVAALLLATLLPSACADDDILDPAAGQYTDRICFTTTAPAFEPDTRSSRPADCFMLRSESGQDSLYVNATVCDFETSDSPATRAPLTTTSTLTSFKVSAYAKNNGAWTTFFHEEENTRTDASSPWSYASGRKHYWPGAEHPMRFCAYSPSSALGLTVNPSMTDGVANTISLSVNEDIKDADGKFQQQQVDLLVAKADEVPGDYYSAYPLAFTHACTAVQFREGPGIQPGTVQKIELVGVNYEGTFSLETMSWTINDTQVRTFNQNVADNGKDVPDASGNTDITNDTDCFIMLPQTLPAGAQLRINFKDKVTGQERVLTAPLDGKTWPQGKKIVYTLSITPGYNLDFASEPAVQDAHYVIYPIKIKLDKEIPGGWTLTSNNPENVTFVEKFDIPDIKRLVDAGYWLDGYNGTSTLTSTSTGEVTVYVFLKENASQQDRDIILSLYPTAVENLGEKAKESTTKTFTFKQYCPAWNGDVGVERIEDGDHPWGFNWNFKIEVKFDSSGWGESLGNIIIGLYIRWSGLSDYVTETSSWWQGTKTFEIDYAKISALPNNVAISNDDGQINTWELRSSTRASDVAALIQQLQGWGGEVQGNMDYALDFAARACAMKNKFRVETTTQNGSTVYRPVLDQGNMVWYLPARNEAMRMNDNLSGDYWTSTAIHNPGTTAYKYTAGGTTSAQDRGSRLHVRAMRKAL